MKNHRQGRTGAASAATVETHARRLWGALLAICRQLRRAQADPVARRAFLEVERKLRRLARPEEGSERPRKPAR